MRFLPNNTCTITRFPTATNVFGERLAGVATPGVGIAIVTLNTAAAKTTVRADSSASRANANETISVGRILVEPRFEPHAGDRMTITIAGMARPIELKVDVVQPRPTVRGDLHHFQVECSLWVDDAG